MEFVQPARPRTGVVFVLLILAAASFSYLGAFAIPQALAASNVIHPWAAGHDPRARWMAVTFVVLLACFTGIAALWRMLSSKQLRRIDAIGNTEERELKR